MINKVTKRSISHPVKIFMFILNLYLAREKYLLAMIIKKGSEEFASASLLRIGQAHL